jgi:hypothetical protein
MAKLMTAENDQDGTPESALRRRAILRALGTAPVILTISSTSAQAQQTFGTSMCGPILRNAISNNPPGSPEHDLALFLCRLFRGFP